MDNSAAVAGIDSFCITDLSRTRVRSEILCRADEGVQGGGMLGSVLERVCMTDALNAGLGRIATKSPISRDSAVGYKRRFDASRFTSALHPAPEIRTLYFRS